MDTEGIRDLIRQKLHAGRLPLNSTPRFWSGPADGEVCDARDKPITKQQLVMESIASTLSDKSLFSFTSRASSFGVPRGAGGHRSRSRIRFYTCRRWTRTPFESRLAKCFVLENFRVSDPDW
jgi:hypothetical protein